MFNDIRNIFFFVDDFIKNINNDIFTMNLKKLARPFKLLHLSEEDKELMKETLIATAKKKGKYDEKAKKDIETLIKEL